MLSSRNGLDNLNAIEKNRYALSLIEQKNFDAAEKVFAELQTYWSQKQAKLDPDSIEFYVAYADYLAKKNHVDSALILDLYRNAYVILCLTEDEDSTFKKEIGKKITDIIQARQTKNAFDSLLEGIIAELKDLPFAAREIVIESFATLLLRGFVPLSGMTVQQHIPANPTLLNTLNNLTNKTEAYKNGTDARYVYQFAREATSGGIIPVYRNKSTGNIYIALICNKRNLGMYNWSAGYTEAPLPGWRGGLKSETNQKIFYDRGKIKDSATKTMKIALAAAEGDWTKIDYGYEKFADGFKADGVVLPKIDINSFQTAARECLEEMHLDLNQFPQKTIFLISYDNTVGISQGDAPGQTSNRSHQYLVYLGEFDEQPPITPGDDVAIADWINVSDIQRKTATEYVANGKPLCIYMLRGLELGLRDLWHFLLQQTSSQVSKLTGKSISRFSNPENIVAEIERFCAQHKINIEGTQLVPFLQALSGDLPDRTYTGKSAQAILNTLLKTANYLMSPALNPETFVKDLTQLLTSTQSPTNLYSSSINFLHFKPASRATDAPASALVQTLDRQI